MLITKVRLMAFLIHLGCIRLGYIDILLFPIMPYNDEYISLIPLFLAKITLV
jgi:hypothetical protein